MKAIWRSKPILDHAKPPSGVIVSLRFWPGWTPDLTDWTLQVADSGLLRQAVRWHRPTDKDGGEAEELSPVQLSEKDLDRLKILLREIEVFDSGVFRSMGCVDDAATVAMHLPGAALRLEVALFYIRHKLEKGQIRLGDEQRVGLRLLESI